MLSSPELLKGVYSVSNGVSSLGLVALNPKIPKNKIVNTVIVPIKVESIVNSYYYGRLIEKIPNLPLAIFWPNQDGSGVHVNISGAGIIKNTKNKQSAVMLLEFLSSKKAQKLFTDINMEYPVNPKVSPDSIVAEWGGFKQNRMNVVKAGELQTEAVKLMDRVGYR